jgi:hypothetical protein
MSNVGPEGRSYKRIERADLDRLAKLAAIDRAAFFESHPEWASLYADRHLGTALCQGAAQHYARQDVGVHDFDVYSFFSTHPARPWYAKRIKAEDFGDAKFGRSPDRPDFLGRRVDLLGRGIPTLPDQSPLESIRHWLTEGRTATARLLSEKAVVILDPVSHRGTVLWPPDPTL